MGATSANEYLRAPEVSWTGLLQASMDGLNPHPPQPGEIKSGAPLGLVVKLIAGAGRRFRRSRDRRARSGVRRSESRSCGG